MNFQKAQATFLFEFMKPYVVSFEMSDVQKLLRSRINGRNSSNLVDKQYYKKYSSIRYDINYLYSFINSNENSITKV